MINLRILSPLEDIFSGEVRSISSVNSAGPFDILPQHANFITITNQDKPIILNLPNGEKKEFKFSPAVIHCHNDKVEIYTDLASADHLI